MNNGRPDKSLTRRDIEYAFQNTRSIAAAARFLNISRTTLRKYCIDKGLAPDLWKQQSNQAGNGISKGPFARLGTNLDDIVAGKLNGWKLNITALKERLIREMILPPQCDVCGFSEQRMSDFKYPLLIHFKNDDNTDYNLDNLQLICYNCKFLYVGNFKDAQGALKKDREEVYYDEDTGELYTIDETDVIDIKEAVREEKRRLREKREINRRKRNLPHDF